MYHSTKGKIISVAWNTHGQRSRSSLNEEQKPFLIESFYKKKSNEFLLTN